jgi:hypothetical protein
MKLTTKEFEPSKGIDLGCMASCKRVKKRRSELFSDNPWTVVWMGRGVRWFQRR